MREILFRGKRVDNGEWVYGYVWKNHREQYFITEYNTLTMYAVTPETVGQCIVPKDKNRNKMFEGDILNKDGHWAVVVEYDRVMPLDKVQYFNSSGTPINDFYFQVWEVAGNIHDKKEEEKCLPEI